MLFQAKKEQPTILTTIKYHKFNVIKQQFPIEKNQNKLKIFYKAE